MSQALRTTPAPRVAAEIEPVSAATMELVLGTGDLGKLTTQQRVEYYKHVCKTIGLNPLTRPFRFLQFQGQTVMYVTRDGTDQLRQLHRIDLTLADKTFDGDLFLVTAQARSPDGRKDEDLGVVVIGNLKGEARANALMKATTKAKRRVTLSICGLGYMSEDELDTMPGAKTFDAEDDTSQPKPVPMITAPSPTTPPPASTPATAPTNGNGHKRTLRNVLDAIKLAVRDAGTEEDLDNLARTDDYMKVFGEGPAWAKKEITDAVTARLIDIRQDMAEQLGESGWAPDTQIENDPTLGGVVPPELALATPPDTLAQQVAECNRTTAIWETLQGLEKHERSMAYTALLVQCDKAKRPELARSIVEAADARRAVLRAGGG
jgi:hypothetical protein